MRHVTLTLRQPPLKAEGHSDMANQKWQKDAACKDLSSVEADRIFFIGPGQSSKRAKIFCASCPVKGECVDYALTYNEQGIWAGMTEDERQSLEADFGLRAGLKERARKAGMLESRNINDFIPQADRLNPVETNQVPHQEDPLQAALELLFRLEESERAAEQLEALVHPFDAPNVPQAIGQ